MKTARRRHAAVPAPPGELEVLRARLSDAEETLRAIRAGEVDAVVVAGRGGPRVFTLEGAEHAYRVLIESMHEGALTLAPDTVVLYANRCFARMIRRPLNEVIGRSFHDFLSPEDKARISPLLKRPRGAGAKFQSMLRAGDGSLVPAQVAIRPLPRAGAGLATIGLVVTDTTEARRTEDLLRALTHRAVRARDTERGSVAVDLHDNITQLLCALLVRSQTLADKLASYEGSARRDAIDIGRMLGVAAQEVERISRDLQPSVLEHLGLAAVLHATGARFAHRTGIPVRSSCVALTSRMPRDAEMALFRIVEEALKNVEQHARAHHVILTLTRPGPLVRLSVADDGCGFDPKRRLTRGKGVRNLGLWGMHERATSVGGDLSVRSARGKGTTIRVRVPFVGDSPGATGAPTDPVKRRTRRTPEAKARRAPTASGRGSERRDSD